MYVKYNLTDQIRSISQEFELNLILNKKLGVLLLIQSRISFKSLLDGSMNIRILFAAEKYSFYIVISLFISTIYIF